MVMRRHASPQVKPPSNVCLLDVTLFLHNAITSSSASWISLSAKELIDDDYSEIEYSDMDGEDDMIYDTPPYYHYEDEHPPQHQQHPPQHLHHHPYQQQLQLQPHSHQMQQSRSLAFAGKGDFASLPSSSTSSSHHSLQEQEQVEEALRAR